MSGGANKEYLHQQKQETQNQTATSAPLAEQSPFYNQLWNAASTAFQNTNNNPFTGNFVAPPTPYGQQGINLLAGGLPIATNIGTQGAQSAYDLGLKTMQGGFLNAENNPYLQSAMAAAIRPVQESLTQQALPQISDASIAGGAYGGARQDLSQERALNAFTRNALDTTGQMAAQNYQFERGMQQNAPQFLNQAYTMASGPGQYALATDAAARDQQNLMLQNELLKFQQGQSAPWAGVPQLAAALGAGGFGTKTGTGTSSTMGQYENPNYEDPFTTALKLGLGAAGVAATAGGSSGFKLW